MFVFKAAVVGAADELAGRRRASRGRRHPGRRVPDTVRRPRRRRLRHRGRRGRPGEQAGALRRARRGHARARDPGHDHVRAVDHRDRRGHAAPRQGRGLPSGRAARGRDRRGRRHVAGDRAGGRELRPAPRRMAVRCADAPGFVVERIAAADDAFVESCLVLEDGVAGLREIDLAAGKPFARADERGLDVVLAELDDPPLILRRLVAQGRLGVKSGQGFYPHPLVEGDGPVKLELRGDVAVVWIDNPPANSLAPAVDRGAGARVGGPRGPRRAGDGAGLGQPGAVLRGRRHQGLHHLGRGLGPAAPGAHPRSGTRVGAVADHDDRRRQRAGARRRLRDRDGLRRAAGRRARRRSGSRRSASGSSRASAARSGCRGSSARPRRSR